MEIYISKRGGAGMEYCCLILYHRHRRFDAVLGENLDVLAVNLRRLFVHRNHRPERIAEAVVAVLGAFTADREVAHDAFTGIEVAMPHEIVRRIDRAGL